MKKRIVSFLLCVALMLPLFSVCSSAAQPENVDLKSIEKAINSVAESVSKLEELGKGTEAGNALVSAFLKFSDVARNVGSVLTLVNGSVTFMRLIGLMEDPTAKKLEKITEQLTRVDEKIDEIDKKLDSITDQMTKMQANEEFNSRSTKALIYGNAWKDFSYKYKEDGIDKLMNQFDAKAMKGIKSWFADASEGDRKLCGIDNEKIIVLYTTDDKGNYVTVSSALNEVPEEYKTSGRYFVLGKDVIPNSLNWNVNTYRNDLVSALTDNIYSYLQTEDLSPFEARDIPIFKEEGAKSATKDQIRLIAEDAANVLFGRITRAEIINDPDFVFEVERQYSNYCSHLLMSEDGIDALFKTLYLTHSFEYEISDDLKNICDRMIAKTGVYSIFVADVFGMSDMITDNSKYNAMEKFCNTVSALESAREKCVTGNPRYCYITNCEVRYSKMTIDVDSYINMTKSPALLTYKNFSSSKINSYLEEEVPYGFNYLGDTNALLLLYTLQSNGVKSDYHTFFTDHIAKMKCYDFGKIVTNVGSEQTLPVDHGIQLNYRKVIGKDYFNDTGKLYLDSMPNGAKTSCIVYRHKLPGSVIDSSTGAYSSNCILHATAIYGESHWWWCTDEAAFMTSPSEHEYYYQDTKPIFKTQDYQDSFEVSKSYNTLICVGEKPSLSEQASGLYDPLASYKALSSQLEKYNESLKKPPEPKSIPKYSSYKDIDYSSFIGNKNNVSDDDLTQSCLALIENAASKAGLAGVPLSDGEKTELVRKMINIFKTSEQIDPNDFTYDSDDPLGIENEYKALKNIAKDVLPEYLLDGSGDLSENVVHLFVRVLKNPIPVVYFENQNGKPAPVLKSGFEFIPYLFVGEASGDKYELLSFEISPDVLKKHGLNITLRLPANDCGTNNRSAVSDFDGYIEMNPLGKTNASIRESNGKKYVEIKADGQSRILTLEYYYDESPQTGIANIVYPMCALMLVSTLGISFCISKQKKKT